MSDSVERLASDSGYCSEAGVSSSKSFSNFWATLILSTYDVVSMPKRAAVTKENLLNFMFIVFINKNIILTWQNSIKHISNQIYYNIKRIK